MPQALRILRQAFACRRDAADRGWTGVDALRFLAAFFIVLYHFGSDAPTPLETVSPLFTRGYLATDFFLILSGYVLGRAYGPQLAKAAVSPAEFLKRRLLRIWPAHLIVLTGFAALMLAANLAGAGANRPDAYRWSDLPAQAMLLQAWALPVGGGGWNMPTWSLSALLACYALFPILWRWVGRLSSPATVMALVIAALVAGDAFGQLVLHQDVFSIGFQYGVVRAAPLFVAGVGVARLSQLAPMTARQTWLVAGSAAAALALLQGGETAPIASMVALALLVWGAGGLKGAGLGFVKDASRVSFSLFLTHAFAGALWFGALHAAVHRALPPLVGWAIWGGGLVFALVMAAAFDQLVDAPAQAWLRRLRSQAPRPSGSGAVQPVG